ncbi:hypothetical protein [Rhodopirellula sp. P2]|uniref:hypothetical protein n=1 Tax=Rhodopirellula sp. P2 TaxID=2127060 RepID=UPI002368A256|nr:hypothetical protein [Rhodopirellula sp. P2]WDQ16385.1 hypothetical protein PSR62_22580 [Rhodopirellula sp. P2]
MSTKKCGTCGASRDVQLGPWAANLCPECAAYRQQSDIVNRVLTRWGVRPTIVSDESPSVESEASQFGFDDEDDPFAESYNQFVAANPGCLA